MKGINMKEFRLPIFQAFKIASLFMILLLMSCQKHSADLQPNVFNGGNARELAREAYEQMVLHVFEPDELEKAVTKLEQARKINPHESFVFVTDSYWTMVQGYKIGDWYEVETFENGTLERSLSLAEEAIKLDPNLPNAHGQMARVLITRKQFDKAQSSIDEMKRIDPENFYYWYYQGILYEKEKNFDVSNHFLDEADKRVPSPFYHSMVTTHRQRIAKMQNDVGKEEDLLKENIKNNPDVPHVYGNYAAFLKCHQRYDEAIVQWENALERGRYGEAVEGLEETKRLKALYGTSKDGLHSCTHKT
jgi:tetratricopeptide (TPR) repeat protein